MVAVEPPSLLVLEVSILEPSLRGDNVFLGEPVYGQRPEAERFDGKALVMTSSPMTGGEDGGAVMALAVPSSIVQTSSLLDFNIISSIWPFFVVPNRLHRIFPPVSFEGYRGW